MRCKSSNSLYFFTLLANFSYLGLARSFIFTSSILLAAGFASSGLAALPADLPPEQLDWQFYTVRPSGELCSGYYQTPELDLPEANLKFIDASIYTESDRVERKLNEGVRLDGSVTLRRGSVFMSADTVRVDAAQEEAQLDGGITLRQQGMLLRGDRATYNLQTQEISLDTAHYVVHDRRLRGSAWRLEQDSKGQVILRQASITSCAPQTNDWRLIASKIKLNHKTGFGDAHNVRMHIHKVPVFYWPWLRFPLDDRRHTGLLIPTLAYSEKNGLDYLQPIYINLAPDYDLTLYPRVIEKRSFLLGAEFRYLTEQDRGQIHYEHLDRDSKFKDLSRWQLGLQHQGQRGAVNYKLDFNQVSDAAYIKDLKTSSLGRSKSELLQQLLITSEFDGWKAKLNFQGYQKLHPSSNNLTTNFSLLNLRKGRKASEQDYTRLPQLELTKNFALTDNIHSNFLVDITYFSKLVDDDFTHTKDYLALSYTNQGSPEAVRLRLTPSISGHWQWPAGYIKPEVKLHHTRYHINYSWAKNMSSAAKDEFNKQPFASVPVTSLDTGLYLNRKASWFGQDFLQTLEPRLFFAYVPYVEQYDLPYYFDGAFYDEDTNNLFKAERISGRDRVGDIQKVTLGLNQRLLSADNGRTLANLEVAKAFYFKDRYLEENFLRPKDVGYAKNISRYQRHYSDVRKSSNIAAQMHISPIDKVKLTSNLLYDDYFNKIDKTNTYISLQPFTRVQLSLGYLYTSNYQKLSGLIGPKPSTGLLDDWDYLKHAEEQYYAGVKYNANDNWTFFFKQSYDYKREEGLDSLAGFEYRSCCWQIQLAYRNWVDNIDISPNYNTDTQNFTRRDKDKGIFVNFVFKGLGGIGQSLPEIF